MNNQGIPQWLQYNGRQYWDAKPQIPNQAPPSVPNNPQSQPQNKFGVAEGVAIGSLIASIVGSIVSYSSNKQNNRLQERLSNQTNAFNERMQDKQNLYNSPANQMQLLRNAGLNPNLAYGNLASAASERVEGTTPPTTPGTLDLSSGFTNAAGTYATLEQTRRENELQGANTRKLNAEAENQEIQNARDRFDLDKQASRYEREKKEQEARIEQINSTIDQINTQVGLITQQTKTEIQRTLQETLNTKYLDETLNDRIGIIKEQYNLSVEQVENLKQATKLIKYQQSLTIAQTNKCNKEADLLQIQYEKEEKAWKELKKKAKKDSSWYILDDILKHTSIENGKIDLKIKQLQVNDTEYWNEKFSRGSSGTHHAEWYDILGGLLQGLEGISHLGGNIFSAFK